MENIDLNKIYGIILYKRFSIKIMSCEFLEIKSHLFISHGLQKFTDINDLMFKINQIIPELELNDIIPALKQFRLNPFSEFLIIK
jgi:hypothetical protein